MLGAARAFLIEAMSEPMAATDTGGERLLQPRAMFRMAGTYAAESAMGGIDMLATSAGAVSIFEKCALERAGVTCAPRPGMSLLAPTTTS